MVRIEYWPDSYFRRRIIGIIIDLDRESGLRFGKARRAVRAISRRRVVAIAILVGRRIILPVKYRIWHRNCVATWLADDVGADRIFRGSPQTIVRAGIISFVLDLTMAVSAPAAGPAAIKALPLVIDTGAIARQLALLERLQSAVSTPFIGINRQIHVPGPGNIAAVSGGCYLGRKMITPAVNIVIYALSGDFAVVRIHPDT